MLLVGIDSLLGMDKIIFQGEIASGIGTHVTLVVPGRDVVDAAPNDWPLKLYPGSLNVHVSIYPTELEGYGLLSEVAALDSTTFIPEFEILRQQFGNNRLKPTISEPRRGDAQVWRAKLCGDNTMSVECWALRRIGSNVGEQLEFVSSVRLRDFGFADGQRVTATLYGRWQKPGETKKSSEVCGFILFLTPLTPFANSFSF